MGTPQSSENSRLAASRVASLRFTPDIYDCYIARESEIHKKVGKATLLKCRATAQSLILHNKMSRKALHAALGDHQGKQVECLMVLLLARSLLSDGDNKQISEAFKYNVEHKQEITRLISYSTDKVVTSHAAEVLPKIGLGELSTYFMGTAETNSLGVNSLLMELVSKKGNLFEILNAIEQYATHHSEVLKDLNVASTDQLALVQAFMRLLLEHIQDNKKYDYNEQAMASNHSILNSLSNLISLISLVQEYFVDLKDTLSVNLVTAEKIVTREVATMSNAKEYKAASVQQFLKNLRCGDTAIKIAVMNRVIAITDSLSDSFFIDCQDRDTLSSNIKEQINSLVTSENRFDEFINKRL